MNATVPTQILNRITPLEVSMTDTLCDTVDSLARVQAQIATLEAEEKTLKQELVNSMQKTILGTTHKAVVNFVQPKPSTDYKAVCEHLVVPKKIMDMFQKSKAAYNTITIYGM